GARAGEWPGQVVDDTDLDFLVLRLGTCGQAERRERGHDTAYETPSLALGHASLPEICVFLTFLLGCITGATLADVKTCGLHPASECRTSGWRADRAHRTGRQAASGRPRS